MLHLATSLAKVAGALVVAALVGYGEHSEAAVAGPAAAPAPLRLHSPDFPPHQLQPALDTWRRGCAGVLGSRLPDLRLDGPGVPVVVRRWPDSSSLHGRCGQTTLRVAKGRLLGADIAIFARQSNGTSCFPLHDEIAHELGHVLGLDDDPRAPRGSIMGPRQPRQRRAVSGEECAAVGRRLGDPGR
jgi:hypothetical protein